MKSISEKRLELLEKMEELGKLVTANIKEFREYKEDWKNFKESSEWAEFDKTYGYTGDYFVMTKINEKHKEIKIINEGIILEMEKLKKKIESM
jgi:hypothetical protein